MRMSDNLLRALFSDAVLIDADVNETLNEPSESSPKNNADSRDYA